MFNEFYIYIFSAKPENRSWVWSFKLRISNVPHVEAFKVGVFSQWPKFEIHIYNTLSTLECGPRLITILSLTTGNSKYDYTVFWDVKRKRRNERFLSFSLYNRILIFHNLWEYVKSICWTMFFIEQSVKNYKNFAIMLIVFSSFLFLLAYFA